MAYVVSREDGKGLVENWYYQYKSNALDRFNELVRHEGWEDYKCENVPHLVHIDNGTCYQIKIKQINFGDVLLDKFLFVDYEGNNILVAGDRNTFWAEYKKLSKRYEEKEDQSDFYSKLEKELYGKGVHIVPFIPILRENHL